MNLETAPIVARDSGILVPGHLAHLPEKPDANDGIARDADGRRRVVIRPELRRLLTRLSRELEPLDLGIVVACKTTRMGVKDIELADGSKTKALAAIPIEGRCGEILFNEAGHTGEEIPDPGYGCTCTRVHYLTGSPG